MGLVGNQRYECFAQAAGARALGGSGPADADQAFPVVFVSGPSRGGFVLLDNAGWDTPALADGDAPLFGPGPDIATALAARGAA